MIPGRAVGGQDKGSPNPCQESKFDLDSGEGLEPGGGGGEGIQSSLAPLGQGLTLSLGVAPHSGSGSLGRACGWGRSVGGSPSVKLHKLSLLRVLAPPPTLTMTHDRTSSE